MGLFSKKTPPDRASSPARQSTASSDSDWGSPSKSVGPTVLSDSQRMAKSAAQTGAEMASRAEWDKTSEGKSHNEAAAWAAKDRGSKSVSGGMGGGLTSQSSNIYNQRG
jgi:hypothetical protein